MLIIYYSAHYFCSIAFKAHKTFFSALDCNITQSPQFFFNTNILLNPLRLWLNIYGLVQTIEQCLNFSIILIDRRFNLFIVFDLRFFRFDLIFKDDCFQVPWITKEGRIFFERETVFGLSKLNQLSEWVDQLNEAAASSFKGDQQAILQVVFCWSGKQKKILLPSNFYQ